MSIIITPCTLSLTKQVYVPPITSLLILDPLSFQLPVRRIPITTFFFFKLVFARNHFNDLLRPEVWTLPVTLSPSRQRSPQSRAELARSLSQLAARRLRARGHSADDTTVMGLKKVGGGKTGREEVEWRCVLDFFLSFFPFFFLCRG